MTDLNPVPPSRPPFLVRRRTVFTWLVPLLLLAAALLLHRRDGGWAAWAAGVALVVLGEAVRFWAAGYIAKDAEIATGGPYAHVRHPSYTGMRLTFAGIGLALDNWLALACAVLVPLAGLIVRVRVEEAALIAGLGEPYRRYAAGRARLIPHVW